MHLKLRIVSYTHIGHELSFSLHRFVQFDLDFLLLTGMINNISHDFFLSLHKFVPRFNVLHNELLSKALQINILVSQSLSSTLTSRWCHCHPSLLIQIFRRQPCIASLHPVYSTDTPTGVKLLSIRRSDKCFCSYSSAVHTFSLMKNWCNSSLVTEPS